MWQAAGQNKTVCFNKVSERTAVLCRFGGSHKGIQPVLWGWLAARCGKQLEF